MAKVIRRSIDSNGKVIGNLSGSLKTLMYDVEFPDGAVKQYAGNVIAENVLSQVDQSGYHTQHLRRILAHKRLDDAVDIEDAYFTTKRGVRRRRQTTVGWQFLCEWRDGSSSWATLKVLKESNPVDIAEYVTAIGIQDEPAFAWWVPFTLKKRDRIVAGLNTRVRRKGRKFGNQNPDFCD